MGNLHPWSVSGSDNLQTLNKAYGAGGGGDNSSYDLIQAPTSQACDRCSVNLVPLHSCGDPVKQALF